MDVLITIATLAVTLGGFALIFGLREAAGRLLRLALLLILIAAVIPVVLASIPTVKPRLDGVDVLALVVLLVAAVTALAIGGWVRFTNRRRRLQAWLGRDATSQKRRVDRGP